MRIGADDEGEYMDIVDDDEELITVGKVLRSACARCTTSTILNCSKRPQGYFHPARFDLLRPYRILLIKYSDSGSGPDCRPPASAEKGA